VDKNLPFSIKYKPQKKGINVIIILYHWGNHGYKVLTTSFS